MAPTTRVQFSPVTPFDEGGSVSGKPSVFEAGFGRSIRSPPATGRWRNLAARRALNAEVPGSRPGRPARVSRGHRPKDRTVRYERTNRGSTPRARTKFSAGRPIAQDTALRTLKLGLESPLVDQGSRCRPTGEALDCRSRGCGFDSRTPRQSFSGLSSNGRISGPHPEDASSTLAGPATGVSSNWPGSLSFKQRMRDRDPPPLPSFGL